MNKFNFIFIILIILLFNNGVCQNNNSYSINSSISLKDEKQVSDSISTCCDMKHEKPKQLNLSNFSAIFYPIGWSEDYKFAYVTETTNSFACDGVPTYFFIYDAQKDSIAYEYCNGCPNNFWDEDYDMLKKQLKKYKIKSRSNFNCHKIDDIKIMSEDKHEFFWKTKAIKKEINLISGYNNPDYVSYLSSFTDPSKKYYIHLLLVSETESEVVLMLSSSFKE